LNSPHPPFGLKIKSPRRFEIGGSHNKAYIAFDIGRLSPSSRSPFASLISARFGCSGAFRNISRDFLLILKQEVMINFLCGFAVLK
jgi:hypothetical protein